MQFEMTRESLYLEIAVLTDKSMYLSLCLLCPLFPGNGNEMNKKDSRNKAFKTTVGCFVRFRVFHEMQRQKLGERDLHVYQISIGHWQIRISMINMCQWA